MSKWPKKWNALPSEVGRIGYMVQAEMRIQQLKMELARLKKRYFQSTKKIKNHIANLEQWLNEDKRS